MHKCPTISLSEKFTKKKVVEITIVHVYLMFRIYYISNIILSILHAITHLIPTMTMDIDYIDESY